MVTPRLPIEQRKRQPNELIRNDYEQYDDIRRQLLRFRYAPEFRGYGKRVPMVQFAAFAGVTRQLLYHIMTRHYACGPTPQTAARLRAAIDAVMTHGIRWRRRRDWIPVTPDGREAAAFPPLKQPEIAP